VTLLVRWRYLVALVLLVGGLVVAVATTCM
jgi:hypothetical protein